MGTTNTCTTGGVSGTSCLKLHIVQNISSDHPLCGGGTSQKTYALPKFEDRRIQVSRGKYNDLVDMLQKSVKTYGHRRALGEKRGGRWDWISYNEFGEMVDACRGGLAGHGIKKGDVVSIISSNSIPWAVSAYATYGLGGMFAPMYEHQLESDWKYILNDSGAKVLIVSTRDIYNRTKEWPNEIETLEKVFCVALTADHEDSYDQLLENGRNKPKDVEDIDPEDICGFIYTSGTTGNPKGVLLSHSNFISNVNAAHEIFPLDPDDVAVSFLPWAHSFGQTVELHCLLSMGGSIAPTEAIEKLVDNFGEVRPTIMVSVPRIFNKIYDGVNKKMEEGGALKKTLFQAAMENEKQRRELLAQGKKSFSLEMIHNLYDDIVFPRIPDRFAKHFKFPLEESTSYSIEAKHKFFDELVFSKIRDRFGGRLRFAFSGGAALSPEVADFIDTIGIQVYEGYGLTETSPMVTANYRGNRKIGSVGKPLPRVRVVIDKSVVEDDSEDGEIIVYGPNVMKGYHNLPEETKAVMTEDGGFRTGDRGRLDEDNFLYITGRIKEQYKLTNGKYVVPAPLEETLQLSPYILQVFIDGTNQPYNAAIVVPDKEKIEAWGKENGINEEFVGLVKRPEVKKIIGDELERLSTDFKGYERIKKFALIAEEFTTENGMLTPTMKLKRRKVLEKYGDVMESLWK